MPVPESVLVPVFKAAGSFASVGDCAAGSGVLVLLSAAGVWVTSEGEEDEGESWEGSELEGVGMLSSE
jgi:hypothetical protein